MEEEVVGAKGHRFAPFCAPVVGCQHFLPLRNVTRDFPAPLKRTPATRPLLAPHASLASFSLVCYGLIPTCRRKMRSSSASSRSFVSFTTTVWVPGISGPLGVSVRRCSCAKFALHSASKVIGLRMKSAWSYGEFEAVTDVTLEGQSLVSLPSASTSGSSPWFRK